MEVTVAAVARRVREALDVPGPVSSEPVPEPESSVATRTSSRATPSPTTLVGVTALYERLTCALRGSELYLSTSDLVFLVAAYDTVLGREPDTPGFMQFARSLQRGSSRLRVVAGLARSPEFAARHTRAAMHARIPCLLAWKVREALPGHWQLFARAVGSEEDSAEVPVLLPDLNLTEMHNRVIELQARHWEMVSLVREGNDAVLERLGRSSGPGGPR